MEAASHHPSRVPRLPVEPEGLVSVTVPGILLLPAPPWSDPERRRLVRPEVAERLALAASGLPEGVRLGFWEGYRPLATQADLWNQGLSSLRDASPDSDAEELELLLVNYVARPGDGRPPHSTGSAVDVAAVDAFDRILSPEDAWGRLGNQILAERLSAAGMAAYAPEWWHWSYGDEEWAKENDCAPLPFPTIAEYDGPGGGI